MSAWCPRCQKQVLTQTREIRDAKRRETRAETYCSECRILLKAETLAARGRRTRQHSRRG